MKNRKKALIVTSVASMIDQFILPSIYLLIDLGYEVDVATNFIKGSTCTEKRIKELISLLDEISVDCYQVDFDRKVLDARANIRAYKQIDGIIKGIAYPVDTSIYPKEKKHHRNKKEQAQGYSLIHSHSPIGGVIGRLAAHKHHIASIYTAHGFHFYKGAPKKNWLIFYPIERKMSRYTDVLITINSEDYECAKKMHAKKTVFIRGVGIDIKKFSSVQFDREGKRKELGIDKNDYMVFSIGELNVNKNHKVVVKALGMFEKERRHHIHYFIAGKDAGQRDNLIRLAKEKNINIHFLGYRTDICELLKAANMFILPSIREGLNVGIMEAMASGVLCLASDIRGNRDLLFEEYLFSPGSPNDLYNKLRMFIMNDISEPHYKIELDSIDKTTINKLLRQEYCMLDNS